MPRGLGFDEVEMISVGGLCGEIGTTFVTDKFFSDVKLVDFADVELSIHGLLMGGKEKVEA